MTARGARTCAAATAVIAVTLALGPAPGSAVAAPGTRLTGATAPQPRQDPGWALDRIDQRSPTLDDRYAPRRTGRGVTVYLLDTGLQVSNAQFEGRASMPRDFVDGVADGTDCMDESGISHGTFVAGIVGGRQTGVAPGVRLVSLRAVVCPEGADPLIGRRAQQQIVVRALDWVRRHADRPAVVNMSLGFGTRATRVDAAVRRVIASGVPVVAAAGNERRNACGVTPARVDGVLTVAASDQQDRSWQAGAFFGTNTGPCVDLYAPGRGITSVLEDGSLQRDPYGATSWATPFVTGAVALELQRHPGATPARLARRILGRATTGALSRVPVGTVDRLLRVPRLRTR